MYKVISDNQVKDPYDNKLIILCVIQITYTRRRVHYIIVLMFFKGNNRHNRINGVCIKMMTIDINIFNFIYNC